MLAFGAGSHPGVCVATSTRNLLLPITLSLTSPERSACSSSYASHVLVSKHLQCAYTVTSETRKLSWVQTERSDSQIVTFHQVTIRPATQKTNSFVYWRGWNARDFRSERSASTISTEGATDTSLPSGFDDHLLIGRAPSTCTLQIYRDLVVLSFQCHNAWLAASQQPSLAIRISSSFPMLLLPPNLIPSLGSLGFRAGMSGAF